MAVIFFDGFERDVSPQYWTTTAAGRNNSAVRSGGHSGWSLGLDSSGTAVCSLRNFGTHSAKKVYLGFGLYGLAVDDGNATGQSFLNIYNSSLALNLGVNICSLTSNTIGFVVRQNNATVATHTRTQTAGLTDYGTYRIWYEWLFLEFEFNIGTPTNTFAMRVNGNSISNGTSLYTNLPTQLGSIAGFNVYQPTTYGSVNIDDLYVSDNTTPTPTGYLGINTQVHSPGNSNQGAQCSPEWRERYGTTVYNPGNFAASTLLNENDGDAVCIFSSQFNQISVFNMNDVGPINGASANVAGVRLNSVARKTSLDSAYKYAFSTDACAKYEIGTKVSITDDNYTGNNTRFVTTNPATSTNWTVTNLNAGFFGVKSVDPAS